MKTAHVFVVVIAASLAGGVEPAWAVVRAEERLVINADDVVYGNLYASGGNVTVHGLVRGDLVVAGGTVVIDGRVNGDLLAAGGELTLAGPVGGDVRAAGGDVTVSGQVAGDAMLVGGSVAVDGTVAGDGLFAAGNADVGGDVGGSVMSGAGELRVDGKVGRGIKAKGGEVKLGPRAHVGGDVVYVGPGDVDRAPGAIIGGEVTERLPPPSTKRAAMWFAWLHALVGSFVLGLGWFALFRGFAERALRTLAEKPGLSVGWGVAAFFVVPVVLAFATLVGALVGGWWLALFGACVYAMAVAITFPLVAAFVGRAAFAKLGAAHKPLWMPMAATLVVELLLVRIPIVGGLVAFAVILFGLGALAISLMPTLKQAGAPSPS